MRLKCSVCQERYARPGGVGKCEVCLYAETMGGERTGVQVALAEAERERERQARRAKVKRP